MKSFEKVDTHHVSLDTLVVTCFIFLIMRSCTISFAFRLRTYHLSKARRIVRNIPWLKILKLSLKLVFNRFFTFFLYSRIPHIGGPISRDQWDTHLFHYFVNKTIHHSSHRFCTLCFDLQAIWRKFNYRIFLLLKSRSDSLGNYCICFFKSSILLLTVWTNAA